MDLIGSIIEICKTALSYDEKAKFPIKPLIEYIDQLEKENKELKAKLKE